ncbi:MAG: thioredoxin fold domain-containing protein [Candidatus Thiodiazotropha sp. (ex Myrtea sp. 'scaly one' KF741663)]|nr:thioredoxin fold domain-containing protein [Candidatus Thiodiazotropha sp. (ex Myrtea sp. 'scaly one' KF741663)]
MRHASQGLRQLFTRFTLALLGLACFGSLQAEYASIPLADNLRELADKAKQQQSPIMLMFSQYHCEFCELMKTEVLDPMQLSGEYENQVVMREVMIDPGEMITNFQGKREAASIFADRYGVFVTPTLVFLDTNGKESAERILGINTIDFLLFYIEEAIETATPDPDQ